MGMIVLDLDLEGWKNEYSYSLYILGISISIEWISSLKLDKNKFM